MPTRLHTGDAAQHDHTAFLTGGGEMGERISRFDWSKTSLGPINSWPQGLQSALSIGLSANFPMAIYWGSELTLLYNDSWSAIPGEKHPWALGRPAREVWSEIWQIIEPLFNQVMTTGHATRSTDQLLPMYRHGFTEECYFDYTFSPIRGSSGEVAGVFNAVLETTVRVIGERRLRNLRELGATTIDDKQTVAHACHAIALELAKNAHDLPFALLYLLEESGREVTLCATSGLERATVASPERASLNGSACPWPFEKVAMASQTVVVENLQELFGAMHCGVWPEPLRQAAVLPIAESGQATLSGFLVVGISPRLVLDDDYRGFLDLLAGHVAAILASARSYEAERKRAEALAEIDRAKTIFFSNVSHEFRTPLTLMLGPVEDLLSDQLSLPTAAREQLQLVNRNGLRLLRLVNSLLDFSRIEAGRVRAVYRPTDLASYTSELASVFRSAIERAGLQLCIDCPQLREPVFVDHEMWEKVVLNLLSNALKFTFSGTISVSLLKEGSSAVLRVIDTGTGIPPAEMPKLFERFHRIENARGRTHEGSGIGLALVQELVKLHGGSVHAESQFGSGTTMIVKLPLGDAHLPVDSRRENSTVPDIGSRVDPYLEEALRWLPEDRPERGPIESMSELVEEPPLLADDARLSADRQRSHVLVADDNADMRQYVERLLRPHYRVTAVADGQAAWSAIETSQPDLVLTDVMMPRLDGFGLLRKLRNDPKTSGLPIIMLSARAGEESRVEGMEAGADDYLVKPFSARELVARVGAHLQMARLRREAHESLRASEERFQLFMRHSPTTAFIKDEQGRYMWVNANIERTFRRPFDQWIGNTDFDIFCEPEASVIRRNDLQVLSSNETREFIEAIQRPEGLRYFLSFKFPLLDRDGRKLLGGMSLDVTDRKQAEVALRISHDRFEALFNAAPIGVYLVDAQMCIRQVNPKALPIFGDITNPIGSNFVDVVHSLWPQEYADEIVRRFKQTLETGQPYVVPEFSGQRTDRQRVEYYEWQVHRISFPDGQYGVVCYFNDITRHVLNRRELAEADRRKDEFLATLAHELRNPLAPIRTGLELLRLNKDDQRMAEEVRATMEGQTLQLVRLVDDLLDISRISSGKVKLRKQHVELATVIDSAVKAARTIIDQGKHRLTVSLPSPSVWLDVDPTRLAQIISNLLTNAAKYTEPGGEIELTAHGHGDELEISVTDTGIGIPGEMLDSIFEMFMQVDQSLERSNGGLGIGLTLVKRLTELHGGTVTAHSQGPHKGSKFVVRLPVVTCTPTRHTADEREDVTSSTRLRVLVVDDNKDAAKMLSMIVQLLGHEVRTAHDGLEAVEVAARFHPQAVLMDIGMPRLNGYEAARRMRSEAWCRETALIALTGWGKEEDKSRTRASGFDYHLVKPVEPRDLRELLSKLGH